MRIAADREIPHCDSRHGGQNARPDLSCPLRRRRMKSELPPPAPALSLQNKLDLIAHDRDVLALLRELARFGLREGDPVRDLRNGTCGRVEIERQEDPPRIVVATDDGSREPFSLAHWRGH